MREGDWKLIEWYEDGRLELFNLREDVGEATDLAEKRPDVATRLHGLLQEWRRDVGAAMPSRNPRYKA